MRWIGKEDLNDGLGGLTATLFMVAILLVLFLLVPAPRDCLIPPNAPTRGFYERCWTFWELWT